MFQKILFGGNPDFFTLKLPAHEKSSFSKNILFTALKFALESVQTNESLCVNNHSVDSTDLTKTSFSE